MRRNATSFADDYLLVSELKAGVIMSLLPTTLQTGEGCEDIYLYILSAEGMII